MKYKISDIVVNYEIRGEGRPLLILHSGLASYFEPIFETLPGWKRIYLDYPGIRQTAASEWIQSSDHILDVIHEFIDHILGSERFVIAGFSYTSYLARGVLKERPAQIEGIALLCPVIHAEFANRTLPDQEVVFQETKFMKEFSDDELKEFGGYVVHNRMIWDKIQKQKTEEQYALDREFFNRLKATGRYALSFESDELNTPFDKPSLIVCGRQDLVVGYKDAMKIIENYPRATFAILDMAGHMLLDEQEDLFASMVVNWLDRINFNQ